MITKPPIPTRPIASKTDSIPMCSSSHTAIERPSSAATMTPIFIAGSGGREGLFRSEEPPKRAGHERNKSRAFETLVIAGKTPVVLGDADIDQLENVDVVGEPTCAGDGEIIVLHTVGDVARNADSLPAEKYPDRQHFQFEPGTAPGRHVAAMPGDPVDEEKNVATLFMDDRFEGLHELGRKIARHSRDFEESECEETVDAFAVAGDEKCPFGILRARIVRFRRQRDAIGLY